MALSKNLLRRLNRTFRTHKKKMAYKDMLLWENVSIAVSRNDENEIGPTQQEANVYVSKTARVIHVEYVHVLGTFEKRHHIMFSDIEMTTSPTRNSFLLRLEGGDEVKFIFGTEAAKNDFVESITIESSDSGNSEDS
ncbi:uncharacterized protein [Euwallacea similis]|uniref:uncharacterized protein n=1 Tax=Euwallacea similis TaxID=1736056 RepID=UPI00344B1441